MILSPINPLAMGNESFSQTVQFPEDIFRPSVAQPGMHSKSLYFHNESTWTRGSPQLNNASVRGMVMGFDWGEKYRLSQPVPPLQYPPDHSPPPTHFANHAPYLSPAPYPPVHYYPLPPPGVYTYVPQYLSPPPYHPTYNFPFPQIDSPSYPHVASGGYSWPSPVPSPDSALFRHPFEPPSPPPHVLPSPKSLQVPCLATTIVPISSTPAKKPSLGPSSPSKRIIPQDPLLSEYRRNGNKEWTIPDIRGHISGFCRDAFASRFIQEKLEAPQPDDLALICDEVIANGFLAVCNDSCGNYVIQKLLERGFESQKSQLFDTLLPHIIPVSLDVYGCRVVQKLVEVTSTQNQRRIVEAVGPEIMTLVFDVHGNHVVQKILEVVPSRYVSFASRFTGRVIEMARNCYGCRVVQRCLQHLTADMFKPILEEFLPFTEEMIFHQYGNYVVQHILEHGIPSEKAVIFTALQGKVLRLARQKYASNICEKALSFSDTPTRQSIIEEILILVDGFPKGVWQLMNHQYGNYVLQKAMMLAEEPQRSALFSAARRGLADACAARNPPKTRVKQLQSIQRFLNQDDSESP